MPAADTQLHNLIKIAKVGKGRDYEHSWRFKSLLVSPAARTGKWFNSRLRDNAFR